MDSLIAIGAMASIIYGIVALFIISDILSRITQFALLKFILSYDVVSFIKEAY